MKYERFEELPVWQAAIQLAATVYELTEKPAFAKRYSLRDQIERASVSVSNNIAEGFERGTNQELLTFLYIACGSAGEVRSMLCLLEKIPGFADLKSQVSDLKSKAESISRQLGAWTNSLKNSELKGERHATVKVKARDDARRDREEYSSRARREREECLKKLEATRRGVAYVPDGSES